MAAPDRNLRPVAPLSGVLSDLSYLVQAAFPRVARFFVPLSRRTYRRLAARYEANVIARSPEYDAALRAVLARTTLGPRWCADIAAGTGAATRLLRLRFPEARIVAVDLSVPMLQVLQPAVGIQRVVGSGWALPLTSAALDLAVIQNAPPNLRELARVVRPGGMILFSLSSAGILPAGLRRWLLRHATPATLSAPNETSAGSGVTWSFQRLR